MSDLLPYIHDLMRPDALPDATRQASIVQTHISVVIVGDAYVYKIKKPVDFGFLDFTTLAAREFYCGEEVRLNRRLAPDVYLGVIPLRWDGQAFSLRPGEGEILDYAVRMRRIPEDRLMKNVYLRAELTRAHVEQIAAVLAQFHGRADTSPEIGQHGQPEVFRINTDENFEQVTPYIGRTIDAHAFAVLRDWTEAFYRSHGGLMAARVAQGRVRDCHGDLHMEHICLTPELAIIDCIEFNERFRYSDGIADIAFLVMDLEFHGGGVFARDLWTLYKARAQEDEQADILLNFYKIYRAFVRGKVLGFQLDDPNISPERKSEVLSAARRYFALAQTYAAAGSR